MRHWRPRKCRLRRRGRRGRRSAERFQSAGDATSAFISGFPLHSPLRADLRGFDHIRRSTDPCGRRPRPPGCRRTPRRRRNAGAVPRRMARPANQGADAAAVSAVHLSIRTPPTNHQNHTRTRFARAPTTARLHSLDVQVGTLLQRVGERRPGRDPIVAVTADHGEGLGEHGEPTHCLFLDDSTIRVPLVVACQGVLAGCVVQSMVRPIDVAPTLLDLSGVPPLANVDGISLRPLLTQDCTSPGLLVQIESLFGWLCCGWAPLHARRDDAWKDIDAPRAELYDMGLYPPWGNQQPRAVACGRRLSAAPLRPQGGDDAAPAPAQGQCASRLARDRLRSLGYVSGGSARRSLRAATPRMSRNCRGRYRPRPLNSKTRIRSGQPAC